MQTNRTCLWARLLANLSIWTTVSIIALAACVNTSRVLAAPVPNNAVPPESEPAGEILAPNPIHDNQLNAANAAEQRLFEALREYRTSVVRGDTSEQADTASEDFTAAYTLIRETYPGTWLEGMAILKRAEWRTHRGEYKEASDVMKSAIDGFSGSRWGAILQSRYGAYLLEHLNDPEGAFEQLSLVLPPPPHGDPRRIDPWSGTRNCYCRSQVMMAYCELVMGDIEQAEARIDGMATYLGGIEHLQESYTHAYRRYQGKLAELADN